LDSLIPKYGAVGDYGTTQGESDINAGSGFWKSILSGDSSKTSQALAPAIDSAKKSASSDMKTTAMFGGRSGGTAASNAAKSDTVHGYITDLIGNLTGKAADSLTSTGGNLLTTGLGAYGQQEAASQEQMQNWSDSILGKGITSGVAAGESAGLGAAKI
jgi:hypothetical protein